MAQERRALWLAAAVPRTETERSLGGSAENGTPAPAGFGVIWNEKPRNRFMRCYDSGGVLYRSQVKQSTWPRYCIDNCELARYGVNDRIRFDGDVELRPSLRYGELGTRG
jgi:hypothetical protein